MNLSKRTYTCFNNKLEEHLKTKGFKAEGCIFNYSQELKNVIDEWTDMMKRHKEELDSYEYLRTILETKKITGNIPHIIGSKEDIEFFSEILGKLDLYNENHKKSEFNIGDKFKVENISIMKSEGEKVISKTTCEFGVAIIQEKYNHEGRNMYILNIDNVGKLYVEKEYLYKLEKIN